MWILMKSCFCGWWMIALSVALKPVQGQEAEHFAVGPLPSNIVLPLKYFEGFHIRAGKCIKEVPTSSLYSKGHQVPPGNGSNAFLSVVERCCEGYKRYKHDRQYCVPKCSNKCQNGFCVAPNVCICFTDHVRNLDNECVTTCPIGCLNGHCHMNGTCTCNPGYTLDPNKKFCGPVCSKGCGVNANCTAPEQCSCLPGYQLNTTTGCEPLCIPNCGNGTCVEPNVCRCNAGFVLKDKTCQANCPRGCQNGRCVENDKCECDAGFKLTGNGTICEPICSKGCVNGNCTGPEHCTCWAGFELKKGLCQPTCKKGCHRGECIKPDVCVCKAGYTLNSRATECKPVCESGCPNGRCIKPNKCVCNFGYNNVSGVCVKWEWNMQTTPAPIRTTHAQPIFNPVVNVHPTTRTPLHTTQAQKIITTTLKPIFNPPLIVNPPAKNPQPANQTTVPYCIRSCLNGHCVGQNICKCNPGYAMEFGTWFRCTPYCPGGCPNGHCTAPNFCTCNYGFVKRNGICVYQFA